MPDTWYLSPEWKALRKEALRRDRYTCQVCGVSIRGAKFGGARPIVDHVEPRRQRPDLAMALNNLVSLCIACHNRKSRGDGSHGVIKPKIGENGFPLGSEWDV